MLTGILFVSSCFWRFFEGFDDQGRGRKHYLSLGLFCMVSSTVILRLFQSPVALAMSSPTFFWRQTQGANFGVQVRHGTDFPTSVAQIYDFDLIGAELPGNGVT